MPPGYGLDSKLFFVIQIKIEALSSLTKKYRIKKLRLITENIGINDVKLGFLPILDIDFNQVFLKMIYSSELDQKVSGYVELEEFEIPKPQEENAENSESENIDMWFKI